MLAELMAGIWSCSRYPEEAIEADGHPVGQQLLYDGLGAPKQQFGLSGTALTHQVAQQGLHHLCQVRQVAVECHGQQRRKHTPVGGRCAETGEL